MKLNEVYSARESRKQLCESVCRDLTTQQRRIVEGIVKEFEPLYEVAMDPQQIQSLFKNTEELTTSKGDNRTRLGRGVDYAKKADEIITNIGKKFQDTIPVQNFDSKFEDLKNKVISQIPQDSELRSNINKMAQYAKDNPGKTAAIIGVLTALAALGGGPVAGAVAGQVLRGSLELMKGEKLSTAMGKGLKTATYGWLTGAALHMFGDWLSAFTATFEPTSAGVVHADFTWDYVLSGTSRGDVPLTGHDVGFFFPEDADKMEKLFHIFNNGGDADSEKYKAFREYMALLEKSQTPEYLEKLYNMAKDSDSMIAANRELVQNVRDASDTIAAVAQGAMSGKTAQPEPTKESKVYTEDQVNALFEGVDVFSKAKELGQKFASKAAPIAGKTLDIAGGVGSKIGKALGKVGHGLTTKITADKLKYAWLAAGSPTDSEDLADFLRDQGIDTAVINQAFQSINIDRDLPTSTEKPDFTDIRRSVEPLDLGFISKMPSVQKKKLLQKLDTLIATKQTQQPITPQKKQVRRQGGGKVPGQLSQTPRAIAKREKRAQVKSNPLSAANPAKPNQKTIDNPTVAK